MDKIFILQGVNELVFETYKISSIHQAGIYPNESYNKKHKICEPIL